MLVTDRFVYIHMPKTGGTFVTTVLDRLHHPKPSSWRGRLGRRALIALLGRSSRIASNVVLPYGALTDLEPKHGTCRDVPDAYRDRLLVSSMRSPYEWYVSQYEFGWWKRTRDYYPEMHPTPAGAAIERALPETQRRHPHFPDLSFAEYVELCEDAARTFPAGAGAGLGLYTHSFVRFHYRDPDAVLARLDEDYARSGRHVEHRATGHFLHTHRSNQDLHAFLLSMGYRADDLSFLPGLGKILPMGRGRRDDQRWETYYTSDLKRVIRGREWALFAMFPEYDE